MIRRYRSPSIPSSSPPSSSSSSSSSTSSSIILLPAPVTDFGCTRCRLLFTDLDAAQEHMLTDPRHARLNSTISDRDDTAIMQHLTSQISVHARLSPAESSAVKHTALNERHIAEVRAARKVLEASGATRSIRDMLKTPGPPKKRAPEARKKMKFSHTTYLTNIIVQPRPRVAPDAIVAVKLVSEILPQPVCLRVIIPAGTITYDGVLAVVAKAYEATAPNGVLLVRELASRGWVADYRPVNGQGVVARIQGSADVKRMMEVGPDWVRRMIIG